MLTEALRLVAEGRARNLDELATHLGISRDLAAQMLSDLARAGYLKVERMGCTAACEGCPQAAECATSPGIRLWTVTSKGQAWLRQASGHGNP
ncbi:MAG: FeoC-like transcriptional regulator [Anaerolineae bacterium]